MSRPYAFIHDGMQHLSWFRDSLSASARIKFDQLNPDFSPNLAVMPGRLIIVGDQTTQMCTPEESQLMAYARDIHQSLIANDHASSRVVIHNYDLLQNIMSYSSIGIGSATSAWSSHLGQVEGTLKDIEAAYQRWRSGVLSKDQFIALRQKLFAILDDQLRGIGRFGTGLKNNSTIKRMLGISSKSYLHTGEITNYVKTLKRVNNVARKLSKGSVVGIALDLGAGALEIHEACSMGRKEMCTKAKFVEV
ncbi:MAG TPA: hypothetical protein VGC62_24905, partial [Pseudomonas sp.]|uniref:hypothetical protein n=1 Tax=Pseudomonas sp. TaxID=306 RepID=UPI002ED8292F